MQNKRFLAFLLVRTLNNLHVATKTRLAFMFNYESRGKCSVLAAIKYELNISILRALSRTNAKLLEVIELDDRAHKCLIEREL